MNLLKSLHYFVSNNCRLVQSQRLLCRYCQKHSVGVNEYPGRVKMSSASAKTDVTSQNTAESSVRRDGIDYRQSVHANSMELMGYKLTLNDDESVATVHMPGLSIESFDRNDNPSVTSLMYLLVAARYFAHHKPLDKSGRTFYDYAKLTEDNMSFMASVEMEMDKTMYDKTIAKFPTDYKFQLGYVGKASFNSVGKLIVPSTGQVLLHNINQLVLINKASRRPMPLPDWWKDKYVGIATRNEPLIVQRTLRPAETCVTQVTVTWTDTDMYNHTNFASYVRYCIDAVHYGIRKNFYKNINKDCIKKGLRKIRMGFVGENVEGEVLTVHTWESLEDDMTICCEIENNGIHVFHTTLCYSSHLGNSLL